MNFSTLFCTGLTGFQYSIRPSDTPVFELAQRRMNTASAKVRRSFDHSEHQMPLLKDEPPDAVKSLEELFAIAFAMEHEAAARYAEIAERMRREGNPALAEVFERLSEDERGHVDNVVEW